MAVRAGAGAAAPGLDPEEIAQKSHDKVVVENPVLVITDDERDDGQTVRLGVPQDPQVGDLVPDGDGLPNEALFPLRDEILPDGSLQLENQPGPDGLDDGGGAPLLPMHRVRHVMMLRGAHVGDRPAAGDRRHPVVE